MCTANPGDAPFRVLLEEPLEARYVRVTATRLWERTNDYALALAEIAVVSDGENVAPGRPVSALDSKPSGGLGGMGIVQLMTPIGTNRDRTNTVLDDRIDIILNNQVLTGAQKQRYIAWRGYLDRTGQRVDDRGLPTNIGANEGDIRPAPVLLPILR